MNIVAILQARVSSTRLPGKVLLPVLGEPMLFRQIERIKFSKNIDNLVVATSQDSSDDELEQMCKDKGLECFRGSLDDVLDRFYFAAEEYNADKVIRLTGDCPLFDSSIADELIDIFCNGSYDYASNIMPPTYPDGMDIEIMTMNILRKMYNKAELKSDREHVTTYIRSNPELFNTINLKNNTDLSSMRWTVDEQQDYDFVKMVYKQLYPSNSKFSWKDVLSLLEEIPELALMNSKFKRNEGYQKSLANDCK